MNRKGGPSTIPLDEESEARLKAWIDATVRVPTYEGALAQLAGLFYYTGIHPACVARKERYSLRVEGRYIRWDRTKTGQPIEFPIIPELKGWVEDLIRGLPETEPYVYTKRMALVAEIVGIPHFSPRAARHTAAANIADRKGYDVAMTLTGTTPGILARYARRRLTRRVAAQMLETGLSGTEPAPGR